MASKQALAATGLHKHLREWVHVFYHRTDVVLELLPLLDVFDEHVV